MSILRSSKYLKHFISFSRNIVVSKPKEIDGNLIQKSLILTTPTRFLRHATAAAPPVKSVEKYLQKLDQDVRRSGRVNKRELDDAFSEMKDSNHASSSQSMMIIRCCGNLLPEESPEVRTKLVKKIWKSLEKMGVPLDVSHYNTLLRVHIENEHDFSPIEILSELQNKGIEPNRVTFQLLITSYCQRGDIDGATKILEFMKEKQLPVNEAVFSSLINGHFQSGDPESAVGILNVMKQANIKPTEITYSILMCGYAKTGDINAINEVLAKCEGEVDIEDKDILEVIYSLAVNNHTDLIDQLIGKLKRSPGYNQDGKNTILRLIVRGQDEAAIKVLRTMTPITSPEGHKLPIGNFLIKQLVRCNRPLETIVAICEDLKNSGDNEYALSVATEASFLSRNPSLSLQLLSTLSKDHELCLHYFWPVLVNYGKAKDTEGLLNTLQQMSKELEQPLSGETLRDYVAPYVPEGELGVREMRKGGVPLASAAAAMVGHFLSKNDLDSALKIAMRFRANYCNLQICKVAVSAFINTKDLKSFIEMVRVIVDSDKIEDATDKDYKLAADKIILDASYFLIRDGTVEVIKDLLQAYYDSGIGISTETAEKLQNRLDGKQLTPEISSLLSKLTSPDLVLSEFKRPQPVRRREEYFKSDEGYLLALINGAAAKGESAPGLKRQLLSYYCVNKELEKAEQLRKELENSGFEFVTGTLVHLMELYINYDNLPEALDIYNKIFKEPSVQIDPTKIIKLAGLMIKLGKVDDAFELFSKHSIDSTPNEKGFNTTSASWRLLNSLADGKDPELLKSVFNKLVEAGLLEPNNITLGPLIKVHILRDDIVAAMEQFEECCRKYRSTPWKNEIACKLIQKEDADALQKLTDLSTDIHGEINSLYDLVLSFIECGSIRQARKILENPGLRIRNQRINSACERYNLEGKVNYLENLVEATKDFNHIDRSDIYYHLLLSYCKTDDVDKAFGLWTQMQDEDVQPREIFLVKLGDLLKKHDRPIPFAVPNVPVVSEAESRYSSNANSQIKEFRKIMNSKSVDEALNTLKRINEEDMSPGDRTKLLTLLINNGRIGEASKLLVDWTKKGLKPNIKGINFTINSLAKLGDVDTMNVLGNLFDKGTRKLTSFSNRHAHCMVTAGRVDELLSKLESDIRKANTPDEIQTLDEEFPRGGIFSVLESAPDSLPKIEEIAGLYLEKNLRGPSNSLWAYYFSKGNFEKANEFWHLIQKENKIMVQPILKQIHQTKDIALCWDLLNLFKSSGNVSQMGPVYSALIDIENSSGNLPECERIVDEALKDVTINDLSRFVLVKLKRSLDASGKTCKFTVPPRVRSTRKMDFSSTSSDSDSDSETAHKPRAQL